MSRYHYERYPVRRPPELGGPEPGAATAGGPEVVERRTGAAATGTGAGARDGAGRVRRYPVAIIGAGPIGLAAAIDLATHGIPSVVLDDNDVVSLGSRAICWAKRTLEIFDRLGIGQRVLDKGVTWKTGRLFHGEREVYAFDLLPEAGHRMPAFVNLQQYYVEQYLVERARDFPDLVDLRFRNRVVDHLPRDDHLLLEIETPFGLYELEADWTLACDGARSPTRERAGLALEGQRFEERFLIADIVMEEDPFDAGGTPERWFWFRPPFHDGQSALLHKQPDDIYRVDLQLGPHADAHRESEPERVRSRIRQVIGNRPFELDWVSVYRFTCAKLARFRHGRLLFVGDSAHVVSPFGARGGNGGIHDVDNLCWKLAAVLHGDAPESLVDSYDEERGHGARENILHSARATRFMSPASAIETLFRDEVLALAERAPFARALINSGRLSTPCSLAGLSLQTPAAETAGDAAAAQAGGGATVTAAGPRHGAPDRVGEAAPDAPLADGGWLLGRLGGRFVRLVVERGPAPRDAPGTSADDGEDDPVDGHGDDASPLVDTLCIDAASLPAGRYRDGVYLIRPDQHVAAHWPPSRCTDAAFAAALRRALGGDARRAADDGAARPEGAVT